MLCMCLGMRGGRLRSFCEGWKGMVLAKVLRSWRVGRLVGWLDHEMGIDTEIVRRTLDHVVRGQRYLVLSITTQSPPFSPSHPPSPPTPSQGHYLQHPTSSYLSPCYRIPDNLCCRT